MQIISSILALAYIVPSLVALTVYDISRTSCTENRIIGWAHGIFQTCIIDRPIDVDDMKIRNIYDTATHGLWFKKNDDVKYLPIELSKSFPKLKMLDANSCSIKKISKTNFKGLKELSGLFLDDNLIVAIHSDTFKDLTSLQWLSIKNNLIQRIGSKLFIGLQQLESVSLEGNSCVDTNFQVASELELLKVYCNDRKESIVTSSELLEESTTRPEESIAKPQTADEESNVLLVAMCVLLFLTITIGIFWFVKRKF